MATEDIAAYLPPGHQHPPLLLLVADGDIGYVRESAAPMVKAMRDRGCDARLETVLGSDHWYAAEAKTDAGTTVQQAMRGALRQWVGA